MATKIHTLSELKHHAIQYDVLYGDLDEYGHLCEFDDNYAKREMLQIDREYAAYTLTEDENAGMPCNADDWPNGDDESGDDELEEDETLRSGCPGGNIETGVCSPNNVRHNWMERYSGLSRLRIQDLLLPGSHNSGSDKQAPYTSSNTTCQDLAPYRQLYWGIRVLDIRARFYSGYPAGDPRRFIIHHGDITSGRTIKTDILDAINAFLFNYPLEIIILNFHNLSNFTDSAYAELASLIKQTLGEGRIIPSGMANLRIRDIWATPRRVVIAWGDRHRDTMFWNDVNRLWHGNNLITTAALKRWMDGLPGREQKPDWELRAVQCAKYVLPFHVPDDFSSKIREWFYSTDQNSYIQRFNIINTDWSLRQRLVDNCIHGNYFRDVSINFSYGVKVWGYFDEWSREGDFYHTYYDNVWYYFQRKRNAAYGLFPLPRMENSDWKAVYIHWRYEGGVPAGGLSFDLSQPRYRLFATALNGSLLQIPCLWDGSNLRGNIGDVYMYDNPYNNTREFFLLRTTNYWYFPTDSTSNANWEYLGRAVINDMFPPPSVVELIRAQVHRANGTTPATTEGKQQTPDQCSLSQGSSPPLSHKDCHYQHRKYLREEDKWK
ncbi:hypothetical protein J2125_001666 [Erwinia toletana]|uniref:1-phosphatidylinositol phosphodiesterase n=1 Tax=Winslowiella toletana TaxID=92490 RepID=A0ABS4P759_9GAMM|nr:hypothetical protein [Winslowiella toletana]MBP2168474.1 hypothetical protein [Winslowiella toletana]